MHAKWGRLTQLRLSQEVLHVHVPHYTYMFKAIMDSPQPWRFGHVHLPGGSANLGTHRSPPPCPTHIFLAGVSGYMGAKPDGSHALLLTICACTRQPGVRAAARELRPARGHAHGGAELAVDQGRAPAGAGRRRRAHPGARMAICRPLALLSCTHCNPRPLRRDPQHLHAAGAMRSE